MEGFSHFTLIILHAKLTTGWGKLKDYRFCMAGTI